jgi:hypothetical protein
MATNGNREEKGSDVREESFLEYKTAAFSLVLTAIREKQKAQLKFEQAYTSALRASGDAQLMCLADAMRKVEPERTMLAATEAAFLEVLVALQGRVVTDEIAAAVRTHKKGDDG